MFKIQGKRKFKRINTKNICMDNFLFALLSKTYIYVAGE